MPERIRPPRRPSNHAAGFAIDINASADAARARFTEFKAANARLHEIQRRHRIGLISEDEMRRQLDLPPRVMSRVEVEQWLAR